MVSFRMTLSNLVQFWMNEWMNVHDYSDTITVFELHGASHSLSNVRRISMGLRALPMSDGLDSTDPVLYRVVGLLGLSSQYLHYTVLGFIWPRPGSIRLENGVCYANFQERQQ